MNDVFKLELYITGDAGFIDSVCRSIEPDSKNAPEGCSITVDCREGLYIVFKCTKLSGLRALFNSYFNLLSALFRIK